MTSGDSSLLSRVGALRAGGAALDAPALARLCAELGAGPAGVSPGAWDDVAVEDGPPLRITVTTRARPLPPAPAGAPVPPPAPGPVQGAPLPVRYRAILEEGSAGWSWSRLLLDPVTLEAAPGHGWEPEFPEDAGR